MSTHRLHGLVAGGGDWASGNRLVVEASDVRLVRRGGLGRSGLARMPLASIADVREGQVADLLHDDDVAEAEADGLRRLAGDARDAAGLVVRFDDDDRGCAAWVFAGDPARVATAYSQLEQARGVASPRSGGAGSEAGGTPPDAVSVPPTSGSHRLIVTAAVLIVVALVGVVSVAVVGLSQRGLPLPSFGSDEDAPAAPASAAASGGSRGDDGVGPRRVVGPYAPGALTRIERQVAQRVGQARPRYVDVIVSRDFARFDVLVGRVDVDAYVWRDGVVLGPEPLQAFGATPPRERAFRRGDVRLAALPGLVRRAGRLKLGGNTEVSTTVIQRALPFAPGVRFLVNVKAIGGPPSFARMRAGA